MATFSERLKQYREKLKEKDKKWTQEYVAKKIGVARVTYTGYENGTKLPPIDTVNKIAELFGVNTDYLMGRSNDPKLTEKDEKDIAKRMEKLKQDLSTSDGLSFHGEPLSEEAIESLLEAIEYAERIATRINKKYIPKKYRDKTDS